MNEEKDIHINQLREKIKTIIQLLERTKEENVLLLKEKQELLKLNKEKEKELEAIQQNLTNLKIAKGLATSEDSHEAKIKINKIVREIDRCIALLNQ